MKGDNTVVHFEVNTPDAAKTAAFYTGVFGWNTNDRSTIAFMLTPQLFAISLAMSLGTVLLAGAISVRRVLKIEPAIVFR